MSFRRMLDRSVTIVPTTVTGKDAHGNDVVVTGAPIVDVPAARSSIEETEDLRARDQESTAWRYFFPMATDAGTPVVVETRSRIIDAGETLEVRGRPETITRRPTATAHHIEATAYRTA